MEPNKSTSNIASSNTFPARGHKAHNCSVRKIQCLRRLTFLLTSFPFPKEYEKYRKVNKDGNFVLFLFPYLWGHRLIQNLKELWISHTDKIMYGFLIFIIT